MILGTLLNILSLSLLKINKISKSFQWVFNIIYLIISLSLKKKLKRKK